FNTVHAERLALAATVVVLTIINSLSFGGNAWWVVLLYNAISNTFVLLVVLRIGLLATVAMFTTSVVLERMPLTLDASKFYAAGGWFALALVFGLAVVGFWLATRQRMADVGRIQAASAVRH